ncbi:LruC domain-containing protein [Parasediminibacterium sp. JCM 36343]|uniref:LruC domain-containing protein n=1 Tax=Parasediminibacterium sp. JCM 36343 TaxID=3374279 RepID=UPI00397D50FE
MNNSIFNSTKNLKNAVAIFLVILAFGQAKAQNPISPALAFNVFAQNGVAFYTSETEGPVAMGGDLTIAGNYNVSNHNNFSYQINKVNIGLLIGGKVSYKGGNSLQVLNNGYVIIGNQNSSKAWYTDQNGASSPIRITQGSNYNATPNILMSASATTLGVSATVNPIFQTPTIDFAGAFKTMQTSASSISSLKDNMVIYNSPNQNATAIAHSGISSNSQIYIKTLSTGVNVLNIAGADFNNFQSLTFSGQAPDASHVLVINVNAAGSFTWSAFTPSGISGGNAPYILYNFYNTTTLGIAGNGVIEGSLFAPFADITKSSNNSNIEGQVIGQSYSQPASGEIHSYNFAGNIVAGTAAPTTASSALVFNNLDITAISSSWAIGNGSNRIVIISPSAALSSLPSSGTAYTASTVYGSGTAIGGGYVVYNGTGNSVVVTGLTANTTYYYTVVEYNGTGTGIVYATGTLASSAKTLADTDGDGVADIYDAYPSDATRAFNTYYPSASYGTYMFEDNWPGTGDYDFNDLVISYRYNTVTNAANKVVEVKASFVTRAIGASFKNGFAIQLDNMLPAKVSAVAGAKTNAPSWLALSSNGTESSQAYANIVVIDNASRIMPATTSTGFVNTVASDPFITPDTASLTITFVSNSVLPSDIAINPYMIINQNRSRELHMANKVPTSKASPSFFGTSDDKSVPGTGIYYVNKNSLPWALDIPAYVPYSLELTDVTTAYLLLAPWAQSSGSTYTDWFSNTATGYRNTAKMYAH